MKILVLAGTEEARKLCQKLKEINGLEVVVSLFQETLNSDYPAPVITGGFGGVKGLIEYIQKENIHLLIDATHPFSEKINSNALSAAHKTGTEYIRLIRAKWIANPNDRWLEFPTLLQACQNIPHNSRIFAALGGKNLGDIIDEIENILRSSKIFLRVMDLPTFILPTNWNLLEYSPPITLESERALLLKNQITHILCRNSGGNVSRHKLEAAAELELEVFMVDRPCRLEGSLNFPTYTTVEALLQSRFV